MTQPVPFVEQFLAFLANPNMAYFLFVLGLLGLVGEFVTGGAIFPGVAGTICLVLGLVGLGQLPTNWGGVILIMAAVVMFLLDVHIPGHGLSVGGIFAFGLGSLLLFTPFWVATPPDIPAVRLSPWVILATTAGVGGFFLLGVAAGLQAQSRPPAVGKETLIGQVGIVRHALMPTGVVHIAGEEWSAVSAGGQEVPSGTRVRIVASEGLTLRVAPVTDDAVQQ